ncbi:ABC transporter substrate-binding protein [Dongshaea marina]|uniref:ABC transporter substrate-binding protein n=1 Tax=Dongshaea marina TaxID=2047966 RepID=UPI000D3E0DDE|nr:ABC transporter substrate-binding protein [Dongshaea marina]
MKYNILFLLIVTSYVNAKLTPIDVNVGVTDGFPIYYYDSTSKTAHGPMVDSFKAICEHATLNCSFHPLPKKRLENGLIYGTIHFGSVVNSPVQKKILRNRAYFTQFNMPAKIGIYSTLPESQIPIDTKGFYGKSIIAVLGWSLAVLPGVWQAETEGKLTIYKPKTIESAVNMLLKHRSPFLYANKAKMDMFLSDSDQVYFKEINYVNQTFALSKSSNNYDEIKNRVDAAIAILFSSGKIDKESGMLKSSEK